MAALSTVALRGAAGVLAAWTNRDIRERGVALMVDTAVDAATTRAGLDLPLDPVPVLLPDSAMCSATVARAGLARCLAIGLTAAMHAGRYQWQGTFPVADAVDRAAWDVLSDTGNGNPDDAAGWPVRAPGRSRH